MALTPFFWLVICHIARNQNVNASLLSWNTVPAVTETSFRQAWHFHKSRLISIDLLAAQRGQTKPAGHLHPVRYSRQAASSLNRRSSSNIVLGYSSAIASTTTGLTPEQLAAEFAPSPADALDSHGLNVAENQASYGDKPDFFLTVTSTSTARAAKPTPLSSWRRTQTQGSC